ncbi:MAG: N-acetylmuramoyl-L-alanine amidase [Candidatus Spyradocola sp.]
MKTRQVALVVLVAGLLFFFAIQGGEGSEPVFLPQQTDAGTLSGRILGVDAGHGGYDSGCTGVNGSCEKDLNLAVAALLREELEARGATVILSRAEDVALIDPATTTGYKKRKELTKRLEIFEQGQVECVVSIHMNQFSDASQHGAQVFYQSGAEEGERLARTLQSALKELDPDNTREANAGDYYILTGTPASALVECGFLSNPEEEARLCTESYRRALAAAIADGLEDFFAQGEG